jgi:hypothetical protein
MTFAKKSEALLERIPLASRSAAAVLFAPHPSRKERVCVTPTRDRISDAPVEEAPTDERS